ncbi:MAG: hypothetical protein AAFP82_07460, partial [Bacteroidota bacterium]
TLMKVEDYLQVTEAQQQFAIEEVRKSLITHQSFMKEIGFEVALDQLNDEKDLDIEIDVDLETVNVSNPIDQAPLAMARRSSSRKILVKKRWWGIVIYMSERLTQDIISGAMAAGALGKLIAAGFGAAGVVTGGVAAVIGAGVATIAILKIVQIRLVNNGKGVNWPISWFQWAALMAAVPSRPAGIATAGAVFFHPSRNKRDI